MPKAVRRGLLNPILPLAFCVTFATLGCRHTPSPDWNGTWKLIPGKSNYPASTLTISISPDGAYSFQESSSNTVRCDGKEQAIVNNRTYVCAKSGSNVLEITVKEKGVRIRTTRDELSTDGSVFTTTVTDLSQNQPPTTHQIAFSRVSGSGGFAGQWRDTSYIQEHADMTLKLDNQTLHIDYPNVQQHIDAPLNGLETTVQGLRVADGTTIAFAPASSHEFLIEVKRKGKVYSDGSLELSSDGKTIVNSSWNPSHPNAKAVLVYQKK